MTPRSAAASALSFGDLGAWRLRVGGCRVVFNLPPRRAVVTVLLIAAGSTPAGSDGDERTDGTGDVEVRAD